MASLRSALPAVAAFAVVLSGCSDDRTTGSPQADSDVTTVELTLNEQPIDLSAARLTCYDFEGHMMVEAATKDDQATHFLMDYFNNGISLSIHVNGAHPDLYEYEQDRNGQSAAARRDGNTVSVAGTIGVALDDTTPPAKFAIAARCGKFVNSPPGSAGVG